MSQEIQEAVYKQQEVIRDKQLSVKEDLDQVEPAVIEAQNGSVFFVITHSCLYSVFNSLLHCVLLYFMLEDCFLLSRVIVHPPFFYYNVILWLLLVQGLPVYILISSYTLPSSLPLALS